MDAGDRLVEVQQFVELDPQACFVAFLREVWIAGGGLPGPAPAIIAQGDEQTRKGCVRIVPGGIHEEILDASIGRFIEYRIQPGKCGGMPVSYHRGRVEFAAVTTPEGISGTSVIWRCSFTALPCCGLVVSFIIRWAFGTMLAHLERSAKPRAPGQVSWIAKSATALAVAGAAVFSAMALRRWPLY